MLQTQSLADVRLDDAIDALIARVHGGAGWWFRPVWLRYELARRPELIDCSYVVHEDGHVLAVLMLTYDPATKMLGIGDGPTSHQTRDHVSSNLKNLLMRVDAAHFHGLTTSGNTCNWCAMALRSIGWLGWSTPTTTATRVLCVDQPLGQIFAHFRKSYRQAIHASPYRVEHADPADGDTAMRVCRVLHLESAGRQTRPESTWEMQDAWTRAGHGFWTIARRDETPIAFAYTLCWRGYAVYMSSASLEPDAPKAIQWAVIQELHRRGVTHYELGAQGVATTAKERGIEFFKRGFGGDDVHVEHKTLTRDEAFAGVPVSELVQ